MKPLAVRVSDITERGLLLEEEIGPNLLDMDAEDASLTGPLRVHAELELSGEEVRARIRASVNLRLSCARCLREFDYALNGDYVFFLEKGQGKQLDLLQPLRAEVMLEYPIKPLCSQECRGLCPLCGADLNELQCDCKKRADRKEINRMPDMEIKNKTV